MSGNLSIAEVLQRALDGQLAQLNTAMPGRIISYDHATQTAKIKPLLKRAVPTPQDDYILEDLPEIPRVKVIHPGGDTWSLHLPLAVGDTVQLVINQWDISEWARTGNESAPADRRRNSLAAAVAFPGLRADGKAIEGTSATDATLRHSSGFSVTFKNGSVEFGGGSEALAVASKVDAEINKIWTFLRTAAVTSPLDAGEAFKLSANTFATSNPILSTPSSVVKASG